MRLGKKTVLVCDCEGTMPLDGQRLARACGLDKDSEVHTQLCRRELDRLVGAAGGAEQGLVIACTQEGVTFAEALAEAGIEAEPSLVNIRERAGWSEAARDALPKVAALLQEAALELPPVPTVSMVSNGVCLVYGSGEVALEAARQLEGRLNVSLLLQDVEGAFPLGAMNMMVSTGMIVGAAGHLGNFEVHVNRFAPVQPSSRAAMQFQHLSDGVASKCDLIIDLSGGPPLLPHHERRDGYLRADPNDPLAVQRALFAAVDLVGEFEKPRYVHFRDELCAHSRNRITGCTRCLDLCPVSAITPNGDTVAIDPFICGGCGVCNSVCPTGAADYAYPTTEVLLERLRTLLQAYDAAGGTKPVLLVHDQEHGWPIIEAMARFGRGLPARVIPFEVHQTSQVGADFLLSALAFGAERVLLLAAPRKSGELEGLAQQIGVTETTMAGLGYDSGLASVLLEDDPDAVETALYELPETPARASQIFLPQRDKRANHRLAATHLWQQAPAPVDALALPPGAAFGTVEVRVEGCTLCMSCVGACPTGALADNPDLPQLRFQEDACIQCGLCKSTCPESVVSLQPRYNFTTAAKDHQVLYEEEPFNCISCGKPFATRGTIEKILGQLGDKHWMFKGDAMERIKMCEDCRVVAQFEDKDAAFKFGERPTPRTTDDYIAARDKGTDLDSDDD